MRLISGVVRYNNIALVKSTTLVMALLFDTKPDSLSFSLSLALSLALSLSLYIYIYIYMFLGKYIFSEEN